MIFGSCPAAVCMSLVWCSSWKSMSIVWLLVGLSCFLTSWLPNVECLRLELAVSVARRCSL